MDINTLILLVGIALLVIAGVGVASRAASGLGASGGGRGKVIDVTAKRAPGLARSILFGILGGVLFVVGASGPFVTVPAGSVGVVTEFGRVRDVTLLPGLHFVIPVYQSVVAVDTRVQPHTFSEIDAASAEYQTVKLTGTMNYHIDGAYASDLYQRVGLDFAGKVIDPAFNDYIKSVVPTYPIGEILGKRDEIRGKAKDALGANLAQYHIIVDDIYIANISFSAEYANAIEQKQVAQQQVSTEQQILEQKKIQAQQQVETSKGQAQSNVELAKGQAEATVAQAKGQAEANNLVNASLTDKVLQYQYIQKLSDKVSVMLVPGGNQFLFDLKGLMSGTTTTPAASPGASPGASPVP